MNKRPRIYIDTSVIGGCCDPEFKEWSQRLMRDFRLGLFMPVVSRLTEAEIGLAPDEVKEVFAKLSDIDIEILEISAEAMELSDIYLRRGILPKNYRNDALHIAIAIVAGVDILVSWNFRHVVHFDKIRMFNSVNLELGYKVIEIYSPREVVSYDVKGS